LHKDSRIWHGIWNIAFGPGLAFILDFPFILNSANNTYEALDTNDFNDLLWLPLICFGLTTFCALIILLSYPRSSIHYKTDFETWILVPSNRCWRWINLLIQAIGCIMHFIVTGISWVGLFALFISESNKRSESSRGDLLPICGEGFFYIFLFILWSLIGIHIGFFAFWKEAQSLFYGSYKPGDENRDILPGGRIVLPESVANNNHNNNNNNNAIVNTQNNNQGNFQQHPQRYPVQPQQQYQPYPQVQPQTAYPVIKH
jgi:hypothetical protein